VTLGCDFWYLHGMKDEMAKPLGLAQRGGSYQLRIVIPKDLRGHYGDRTDFRISLGKLDKALAYPLAHRPRAEKESEFAQWVLELTPTRLPRSHRSYPRPLRPRSKRSC